MINTVTTEQKDALREVLDIAANNASNSLSLLLKKKVNVITSELHIDTVQNMPKFIKNPQEIRTVILVEISKDMPGHLMIICDPASTIELLNILTGRKSQHIEVIDEYEKSALCEVGNILTGTAISALNDLLHFEIVQSVPEVAIDMVGALFNNLMAQVGMQADTALEFNMEFKVEDTNITGNFMGLLSPDSTRKTLQAISDKKQKSLI